ncbi:MAG TPA: right-handed parallel beta-helix repeat-containing protein [Terriglobales bacterium]|jgi:hypothetical protein|nr:right-handed parallel beta-helix repeat-containing protein [Terriglobales bacterium]
MRRIGLLTAVLVVLFTTTLMSAQASRTWVSGVGDDANPCSRTAPCKTFAGAISKTAAGGEIDALDPAGYGAVTITKAITIDGGGGQVASVLVSGTNGIVVQAGPSDVVILRNLRFNGIGTGINGIRFLAGKDLNVESCYIFGFTTNGVDIALNQATVASVHILNSVFKNNGGVGVRATNAVAPNVEVEIDHTAIILDSKGVEANANSRVVVTNSQIEHAATDGITADSPTAQVHVSTTNSSFNANGITATLGGNAFVASSSLAFNSTCSFNNNGGSGFFSYGDNELTGTGTCGTITPKAKQ